MTDTLVYGYTLAQVAEGLIYAQRHGWDPLGCELCRVGICSAHRPTCANAPVGCPGAKDHGGCCCHRETWTKPPESRARCDFYSPSPRHVQCVRNDGHEGLHRADGWEW